MSREASCHGAHKGRRGDDEFYGIFFYEFSDAFCFFGGRVGDDVKALDQGEKHGDGASKAMKDREGCQETCIVREVNAGEALRDISQNVFMSERDSLGCARGARGEK